MRTSSTYLSRGWLIDTSGFFALQNSADSGHATARALWHRSLLERRPLVTTNFIIAEAHALMLNRWSHAGATAFLSEIYAGNSPSVERVTLADEARALEVILRQVDKRYSMVDALSFAVMERLGIGTVFGFDRDFLRYGFSMATP